MRPSIPAVDNEWPNPSFETATTGFDKVDFLGPGFVGPDWITDAYVGAKAIRYTFSGDGGQSLFSNIYGAFAPGDEVNGSLALKGTPGHSITIHFCTTDSGGSGLVVGEDATYVLTADWVYYFIPPMIGGATAGRVYIEILSNTTGSPQELAIDAIDVRRNMRFDNYVDGDQGPDIYGWYGTPHNSRSYRKEEYPQGPAMRGGIIQTGAELFRCDVLGNEFEDLSEWVIDGTIVTDIDRDIKTTLSLNVSSVLPFEEFDWVKVYRTIYRESTGRTTRTPAGIFQLTQPSATWLDGTGRIAGLDPTIILSEASTTDTYNIAAGTNYITAIRTILDALGLVGRHAFPADARVLPTGGKSWPSGTTYLRIVNDLLDALSFYAVFMLSDGRLTSLPYQDRTTVAPNYVWSIGQDAEIIGDVEELANDDNLYNFVIVTKTDSAQVTTTRTAENLNTAHKYSTVALGAKAGVEKVYKTKKIEFNEAADANALQAKADETLQRSSMLKYANATILPVDDLSPHKIAQLDFSGHDADRLSGPYYIENYSIPFGDVGGTAVKMRRVESTS